MTILEKPYPAGACPPQDPTHDPGLPPPVPQTVGKSVKLGYMVWDRHGQFYTCECLRQEIRKRL